MLGREFRATRLRTQLTYLHASHLINSPPSLDKLSKSPLLFHIFMNLKTQSQPPLLRQKKRRAFPLDVFPNRRTNNTSQMQESVLLSTKSIGLFLPLLFIVSFSTVVMLWKLGFIFLETTFHFPPFFPHMESLPLLLHQLYLLPSSPSHSPECNRGERGQESNTSMTH